MLRLRSELRAAEGQLALNRQLREHSENATILELRDQAPGGSTPQSPEARSAERSEQAEDATSTLQDRACARMRTAPEKRTVL